MRVAAMDLGTNSFLCLVAEGSDKIDRVLADEIRITRMGAGVHETNRLSAEALARAEEAFIAFSGV
ncbi:MAG: Ppx/GppA family phosphatase, partial [Bdellovibrionales bacterium]|nr:Ppx/GppA family phosphatase [Bdellovibrionales bacterium]